MESKKQNESLEGLGGVSCNSQNQTCPTRKQTQPPGHCLALLEGVFGHKLGLGNINAFWPPMIPHLGQDKNSKEKLERERRQWFLERQRGKFLERVSARHLLSEPDGRTLN